MHLYVILNAFMYLCIYIYIYEKTLHILEIYGLKMYKLISYII